MREHVFAPAGMHATEFCRDAASAAPLAQGYTTQTPTGPTATRQPNDPAISSCGGSAGGGYSTAMDLARFAAALLNHKLLDVAHTELATTGKVDMPSPGLRYGYGFGSEGTGRNRFLGTMAGSSVRTPSCAHSRSSATLSWCSPTTIHQPPRSLRSVQHR